MKRQLLALMLTASLTVFGWTPAPVEPGGPVSVEDTFAYQPGTQLMYQLDSTVTTRMSYERDGKRGVDTYTMRVIGDVQLDVVSTTAQKDATLGLRLVNPSITYSSDGAAKQMVSAQGQELTKSFDVDTVLVQAKDGQITSFLVDPNALPDVNDMLRGISSALQITLEGSPRYTRQETTVSGVQNVQYNRGGSLLPKAAVGSGPTGSSPVSNLQRDIQSMHRYADPNVNSQKTRTSGNRTIRFNTEEGHIENVHYYEVVRSVDGSFQTNTTGRLTKTGGGPSTQYKAAEWKAQIARLIPSSLMGQPRLLADREPASIDEVVALVTTLADSDDDNQASRLMLRLSQSLKNNPNGNHWVLQGLKEQRFSPDKQRYLIGALGSSGEETAQLGLLRLSQDHDQTKEIRKHALVAVGLTANPHPQVVTHFFDHMRSGMRGKTERSWAQHALLLGAMVHRSPDQAFSKTYTSFMEQALTKDTPSAKACRILIKSLGNAGQSEALPLLESYLGHDQEAVRADVVYALRKLPFEKTKTLVVQDALWDSSPSVRIAALRAMASQALDEEVDQALDALAEREDHRDVQATLAQLVTNRIDQLPSGNHILQVIHDQTDSTELRQAIRTALNTDNP